MPELPLQLQNCDSELHQLVWVHEQEHLVHGLLHLIHAATNSVLLA